MSKRLKDAEYREFLLRRKKRYDFLLALLIILLGRKGYTYFKTTKKILQSDLYNYAEYPKHMLIGTIIRDMIYFAERVLYGCEDSVRTKCFDIPYMITFRYDLITKNNRLQLDKLKYIKDIDASTDVDLMNALHEFRQITNKRKELSYVARSISHIKYY